MSTTVKQETKTNILQTAQSTGDFKLLMQAIQEAGLSDALNARGPLTVFAPNDKAFRKLPSGTMEGLMKDIPKLKGILSYHMIDHRITMDEMRNMTAAGKMENVKTLQGSELTLKPRDYVNNSRIVKSDIETTNGIIHVVDQVLMPSPTQ